MIQAQHGISKHLQNDFTHWNSCFRVAIVWPRRHKLINSTWNRSENNKKIFLHEIFSINSVAYILIFVQHIQSFVPYIIFSSKLSLVSCYCAIGWFTFHRFRNPFGQYMYFKAATHQNRFQHQFWHQDEKELRNLWKKAHPTVQVFNFAPNYQYFPHLMQQEALHF